MGLCSAAFFLVSVTDKRIVSPFKTSYGERWLTSEVARSHLASGH